MFFKISQNRHLIFGLPLTENLSQRTCKNRPIWSHCSAVTFSICQRTKKQKISHQGGRWCVRSFDFEATVSIFGHLSQIMYYVMPLDGIRCEEEKGSKTIKTGDVVKKPTDLLVLTYMEL